MYYINFDENGNQAECRLLDEAPEEAGWYEAGEDIFGKRFKLINNQVVTMTQPEIDAENSALLSGALLEDLRRERNYRMSLCDWTQGADSPLSESKKQEWAEYRQLLRDFPDSVLNLENPEWPVPPS